MLMTIRTRNFENQFTTGENQVAMTLAHFYGTAMGKRAKHPENISDMERMTYFGTHTEEAVKVFEEVINELTEDFGTWIMPWGEVNRYQRTTGDIIQHFDDTKPSIPIGFASSRWGALAAYGARYTTEGAKKIYGTRGNSFVAVVEFGEKVKAKSILAGGQSGDPDSPHFDDQIEKYKNINWKEVLYYREDVLKRAEETYSPGNR